ncbi:Hypothetical_protein [Hexamita inflata]|uniref:Hypothetical_protein n=1 Tax=Hexamita inflata TaxID=28002 RepID=A0AA86NND6_9EUKA|nr:Hypothetical protein HINF_LOCUS10159 [Hexamita inflata]
MQQNNIFYHLYDDRAQLIEYVENSKRPNVEEDKKLVVSNLNYIMTQIKQSLKCELLQDYNYKNLLRKQSFKYNVSPTHVVQVQISQQSEFLIQFENGFSQTSGYKFVLNIV